MADQGFDALENILQEIDSIDEQDDEGVQIINSFWMDNLPDHTCINEEGEASNAINKGYDFEALKKLRRWVILNI